MQQRGARAIVFDLDDTLYPERSYAFSGFAAVGAAFEDVLGTPSEAATHMRRLFDTEARPRVFNALLAERGIEPDPALIARMIETYRAHAPAIQLHADAHAALSRLSKRYKLGIITDGPAIQQRAKIDALRLEDRAERIILTDELGQGFAKPRPHAFELMAESLGVDANECVYVADNASKDFIAPNALDWMSIQVRRSNGIYRNVSAPLGGAPQHVIDTLHELDGIV